MGKHVWFGRLLLSTAVVLATVSPSVAQTGAADGQWRAFAGDVGATKYAGLNQITADNVADLEIVWRRPSVDQSMLDAAPELRYGDRFSATPIMVDGVLYSPNAVGLVEAFDPGTGETLWVQHPLEEGADAYRGTQTRGVAYWTDGTDRRIIVQRGEWMYALNAATGEPYPDFGDGGRVDLTTGLAEGARYRWGGAPTVVRDVVVLGQSMSDTFMTKEDIRGGCPGVRRPHRSASMGLSHGPPSGRVRDRHVGRRRLGIHRSRSGLVAVQRRRGARLCLHADHLVDKRHVWRASSG